jgi:transcriptional regulator with XRE-family HTH domain
MNPETIDDFGSLIRGARLERKLTQEDVAYKVGVEQTALSKMERGVLRPAPEMACKIARVLGLDERLVVRSSGQ